MTSLQDLRAVVDACVELIEEVSPQAQQERTILWAALGRDLTRLIREEEALKEESFFTEILHKIRYVFS